jgi:hypothetical protein
MGKKGLLAFAVAMVAASVAGAGAVAPPARSADLSAAVPAALSPAIQTLITTGVIPTDVRSEPGVWNYAGPNCPGPGWNCVTLGTFSVTQSGTVAVAECPATGTCPAIDQTADVNVAKCEQKVQTTDAFVTQRCPITQTGEDNQATVVQVIEQTGSAVQGALQEAVIKQTGTGSTNQLQVDQEVKQFTDTGTTHDQDAYQVITGPVDSSTEEATPATQTVSVEGDNQSQITQTQVQRAKNGTTQTQNDGEFGAGIQEAEPDDCYEAFLSPSEPHACVNLEQTAVGGHNQSQLRQTIDQDGTTPAVASLQQQGVDPADIDPEPDEEMLPGGLDGHVHQDTVGLSSLSLDEASGSSQNQATQSETQRLHADPETLATAQEQYDPMACCGFSTVGPGSDEISQHGDQLTSEGEAVQLLTIWGTSNVPDGDCAISHDAKNNADETSESFSFEPCFAALVQTTCASGPPPPEDFFIQQVGACTTQESVGD